MKSTAVCYFPTMLHFLAKIICLLLLIFIYCEFLIYYFVLLGCSWPQLSKLDQDFTIKPPTDANKKPLHVMFIADTHLLGSREGHWLDKLRREWQMYRSFQSARFLFEPQVIIFLGDVTDEGKWCSDKEWEMTVNRFHSLFSIPTDTKLYVLAGNHDIGFHYDVSDGRLKRF
jgi:metallophosphoesterase superfamily enzyme